MTADTRSIDVLLSPRLTLVVDVLRALGDFEASYDLAVIDMLEDRLARVTDGQTARAIVSDALLLGFALRNRRTDASWPGGGWELNAVGARTASGDECATLALIAAAKDGDTPLALEAARHLAVRLDATVSSLARGMGERLAHAGFRVQTLDWAPFLRDRAGPGPNAPGRRAAARS